MHINQKGNQITNKLTFNFDKLEKLHSKVRKLTISVRSVVLIILLCKTFILYLDGIVLFFSLQQKACYF